MKTNLQQTHECEYLDPKVLIPHPNRKDFLIAYEDKPQHVRESIDRAFEITPYPILPIIYTEILVEGVIKKAFIDGDNRIRNAIKYGFELIPAVKIDLSDGDTIDDFKAIIANLNYHRGLTFEQGKIAAAMWLKIHSGQGKRTDLDKEEKVKADELISGYLGITASKTLRIRTVYERNPGLLKQVDEEESFSLSGAYNSVKKDRKLSKAQWASKVEDEEEVTVADCDMEDTGVDTTAAVADDSSDYESQTDVASVVSNEPITDTNLGAVEADGELSDDGSYVLADCPCCKSELIINLKK